QSSNTKKSARAPPAHSYCAKRRTSNRGESAAFAATASAEDVEVRKVSVALLQVEAVPDEELVRDGEADVADGEVFDQPPIGAVEQGRGRQGGWRPQGEGLAEVVERQTRVDHVLDDQDVPVG